MKFARILKQLTFNLIIFRLGLVWARPYPCPSEVQVQIQPKSAVPIPHRPLGAGSRCPFFLRAGGRTADAGGGGGLSPSRRAPLTHAPTPRRPLRLLAIFLAPSEVGRLAAATSRVDPFSLGCASGGGVSLSPLWFEPSHFFLCCVRCDLRRRFRRLR